MKKYNQETESKMRLYFSQLNEKDKRHYAAIEVIKLGYGGQKHIIELFGLGDRAIRISILELSNPKLLDNIPEGKIRHQEGGRKKEFSEPDLVSGLKGFIDRYKASSPTNPDVYWKCTYSLCY